MSIGWFIDGAYLGKLWQRCSPSDNLSFLRLRQYVEYELGDGIEEAYYFDADPDPNAARSNSFYNALSYPPPTGPGLRVKLYWLATRSLYWPASMGGGAVLHPQSGQQYELTTQKAVDVGIAFHLLRSHANRGWAKLALATGDGDFYEVIQYLVEVKNVDLYLIGSMSTISEELRPYARRVIEVPGLVETLVMSRQGVAECTRETQQPQDSG